MRCLDGDYRGGMTLRLEQEGEREGIIDAMRDKVSVERRGRRARWRQVIAGAHETGQRNKMGWRTEFNPVLTFPGILSKVLGFMDLVNVNLLSARNQNATSVLMQLERTVVDSYIPQICS